MPSGFGSKMGSAILQCRVRTSILGVVFVDAVLLVDERPLQDDLSLLVPLVVLRRVLVHPAQLHVAVLARDVPHDVAAGQHLAHLHVAAGAKR